MINHKVITGSETHYRYHPPPDRGAKLLLLTTGKVATIGRWGDGSGVIAWAPLPKRSKDTEKQLGLI